MDESCSSDSHLQRPLSAGGLGPGFGSISEGSTGRKGTQLSGPCSTRKLYFILLNLRAPDISFFKLPLFEQNRKSLKIMMILDQLFLSVHGSFREPSAYPQLSPSQRGPASQSKRRGHAGPPQEKKILKERHRGAESQAGGREAGTPGPTEVALHTLWALPTSLPTQWGPSDLPSLESGRSQAGSARKQNTPAGDYCGRGAKCSWKG